MWQPPSDVLRTMRENISNDPGVLRDVLANREFKKLFGDKLFEGTHLKTAPKGFDKNDPAIDLLRLKS